MGLSGNRSFNILIADDDSDDRQMIKEAFEENNVDGDLHFVVDGEDLMNFLNKKDKYEKIPINIKLDLILLDLNMPKKDGREALVEIKTDPRFKTTPVIVFSTSNYAEDISNSYNLGVNCFISKPSSFKELIDVTNSIIKYWFQIVQLPLN